MKKAELLNLGKLKATKDMIDTAAGDKPKIEKGYGGYKRLIYQYSTYYRAEVFKDILKVAVFTRDDLISGNPNYEIYLSKSENKYLTYDTINEKWKTSKIDNLYINDYYPKERYYSTGSEKKIVEYLNNEKKTGYESIFFFQSEIKKEKLEIQHKRITDRIDSAMELVPELPKGFDNWINNTAMLHSRYIYYNYSRNVKEGYCTHCSKLVPVTDPKHNREGICKVCKSKITYKAIKKAALVNDEGYASIMQKTREGFVLRYFEIRKKYLDYKNPELDISERVRILYDKSFNETGTYEFAEFKNTSIYRWCIWENKPWSYSSYRSFTTYVHSSTVYERNLKKVFEGTEYQYCAVDIFTKGLKGERFFLAEYLKEYNRHKYIEYLVKLGLYRIVKDNLRGYDTHEINQYGKRPHEVLKVRPEQVKMLSDMNANMTELRVLQKANAAGVKITKEQIRWIAEYLGRSELINYMRYSTVHKFIRYMKDKAKNKKMDNVSSDYYDYLEYIDKLGYDLNNPFLLFPKNLKEAHDQAAAEWIDKKERIDKMKEEERNIEMSYIAEELVKQYAMKDKHFSIRIPWTCEEIKKEGHTLHHCVGTYIDKVLRRETIILFIRKLDAINTPYYTMEVKNHEVNQVRGKNNCDMTPEVKAFVEKFKVKKLENDSERKVG